MEVRRMIVYSDLRLYTILGARMGASHAHALAVCDVTTARTLLSDARYRVPRLPPRPMETGTSYSNSTRTSPPTLPPPTTSPTIMPVNLEQLTAAEELLFIARQRWCALIHSVCANESPVRDPRAYVARPATS